MLRREAKRERGGPAHAAPAFGERGRGATRARQRETRGAQRSPGVVCRLARPDEVPERLAQRLGRSVDLGQQVGEEAGALGQALAQQQVLGLLGRARRGAARGAAGRRAYRRGVVAEVEGHPARASERAGADPDQLAAGAEMVEPGLRVGARAPGEDVSLPALDGQCQALQRHEDLAQAVDSRAGRGVAVDPLPGGQEGGQPALLGGLDLLAQSRQRGAAQPAQDLDIAPVTPAPSRAQLAANDHAVALELSQHGAGVEVVAGVKILGGERPVRPRVARDELTERIGDLGDERLGEAPRGGCAEGVAVEARLVGCDQPGLACRSAARRRAVRGAAR